MNKYFNIFSLRFNPVQTIILLVYISIIIYASFNPIVIFKNQWRYDVYIHFIEYFILGFLFINALRVDEKNNYKFQTLFFLLVFPLFDEGLQYFTPNRISSFKDVLVDLIGGVSGALIRCYFIKRIISKNDF